MKLLFLSWCVIAVLTQRVSSLNSALQSLNSGNLAQQISNAFAVPNTLKLPTSLSDLSASLSSSLLPTPPSPATPSAPTPVRQSITNEDDLEGFQGQKQPPQSPQGLNGQGQAFNGQDPQGNGLQGIPSQGQNLPGQIVQRKLSPQQVGPSQNLAGPNMVGQNLPGPNFQRQPGSNIQGQNEQGLNFQGQNFPEQGFQSQNSPGQSMQSQSFPQAPNGQNTQEEDLYGPSFQGEDFNMAFLDSNSSRAVVQQAVRTISKVFTQKPLRDEILKLLKKGEMFQDPNVFVFIESLQDNVNRLILEPDNLASLSQLLDIGTELLLDEKYNKIIRREMALVDDFLEDTLVKLIFNKFGHLATVFTRNTEIYESAGNLFDQVNVMLDKNKLKQMQDFALSLSTALVGN